MTYIIILTGSLTSLIFHLGSKELPSQMSKQLNKVLKIIDERNYFLGYCKVLSIPSHTWRDFICDSQFYLISLLWMLTRVISNVSQVYLPLYIIDTTDASQVDRVSLTLLYLFNTFFFLLIDINRNWSIMCLC